MSEIKGQLLGIVLVVAVFGAVGSILVTAFQKAATDLGTTISENTEPKANTPGTQSVDNNYIIADDDILVY